MRRHDLPRTVRALAFLVLGLSLAGTSAMAQECTVKIGAAGPLTGGASAWGLAHKAGAEFIAAWTNDQGGLQVGSQKCKVSVVSFDSQYTSAGGAAASNFFASQDVHAVIGPVGAPEHTGFKAAAKRHGQLNFTPTFAADALGPDFPLAFHENQGPAAWGIPIAKEAMARFKFKTAMVIGPNDQAGTDVAKGAKPIYTALGVNFLEEYYQRGTTNFAPLAQRVMLAKPDTIEMSALPPGDLSIIVRQLLEAGYKGAFGILGGSGPAAILQGAGGLENVKAAYWLEFVPFDDPGAAKMRSEHQRVMKSAVPENALFYTSAVATEQVLRSISRAGTDKDGTKIAAEMRKSPPESAFLGKGGWRGKTQFGVNQELAFPVGMGLIVDGKRLGVRRIEVASE